ncbi:MAG: fatty acid desaturase [Cyanobacteria bacterium P01_A01_bin.37]
MSSQTITPPTSKLAEALNNTAAIAYALLGYAAGVTLLFVQPWWGNVLGVMLTAHALLIASVLIHEFIHGTIFASRVLNAFWGRVMMHVNGACYSTWPQIYDHHINHHVHVTDFIPFDYAEYIATLPSGVRSLIRALEWAYIPGFEFLIRLHVMTSPFTDPKKYHLRLRTSLILAYRIGLMAVLAYVSWKAFLLYGLSYVLFVCLLRLVETFHHTFEYTVQGSPIVKRDRAYEQINTFSNVVSIRYPWLNMLYLNFGYHNAHHDNMRCPWYDLPKHHQRVFDESSGRYGEKSGNLLSFWESMKTYHQFRVARIEGDQGEVFNEQGEFSLAHFTGGAGASFLTPL